MAAIADPAPPRIGVLGALMARATPAMAAHLRSVRAALEAGGAQIVDVDMPESFPVLRAAGEVVLAVDAAHAHAALFAEHAADYPPRIRELVERGRGVSALQYLAAQEARRAARAAWTRLAARHDVLLAPTIGAPAPRGLAATGDPSFCAPFTFAGLPATLAADRGGGGLPLAVQLDRRRVGRGRLLAAAAWCEGVIAFDAGPPL